MALGLAACARLPRDPLVPVPEPLSAGRRALFGLDPPRTAPLEYAQTLREETSDAVIYDVKIQRPAAERRDGDPPLAEFELYEPLHAPPPWPAVVVSPILKGGYVLERWVAGVLVPEGIAVAIPMQPAEPIPSDRSPEELADSFLESVRGTRAVVDWLATWDRADATRLGSVGTSLGALRNVVLLAGEPRLRANLLALGGLDAGWILAHSTERSVDRYRRERAALEGIDEAALARRFASAFFFHDETTARAVDGRTVLLVLARSDDAVPFESGLALREALGRPETRVVPLGHYGTLLALPWIRVWMIDFFRERFFGARRS